MEVLTEVLRPRPFEELSSARRDALVLQAARDLWRSTSHLYELIGVVDRSMSYRDDAHVSPKSWLQAVLNCDDTTASRLVAATRLVHDLPELADAFGRGEVGADQLAEVVKLRRNPRCRPVLAGYDALLANLAATLDFDQFQTACARFVAWADPDGTHRSHEQAHERRGVSGSIVGTDFQFRAHGGNVDGAAIIEILDHVAEMEFEADWAALVAEHGEGAPAVMLARTPQQRRFDAFNRIFHAGAEALHAVPQRVPHVDFVIDLATFEAAMRRIANLPDLDDDIALETILARRCETGTGIPVDPMEIVAAAINGTVRRVVLDSAGILVDAGRTRRLFSPRVASIIRALNARCTWPGCDRPAHRCEIDHADPWTGTGGETDAANARLLCDHHNRYKQHGFHTWRDPNGHWHTIRPDGTEITPRARGSTTCAQPPP
ncbi:MAG: hypothetical protein JWM34_2148 [Ilumatobacteraceae bacterium]|nr:hypothetical protein [Ilumatobacteraceae bacterium]